MKDLKKLEDELVSKLAFKKEKELLNQFMDLYYNRRCNDVVEAYKDGFTAGALLIIEIFIKN